MFFVFISRALIGQYNVNIQSVVMPPHTPYLSDFVNKPNKIMVTISNTGSIVVNLKLAVKLTGDNGIKIQSNQYYKPSTPITLNPGQTKTFNTSNTELKNYFSSNALMITGISKNDLAQSDVLPEGNYDICLRAYDYNTTVPLSEEEPVGCAQMNISYLDPPVVVLPPCGEEIKANALQNIIFNWTPPSTTAPGLVYRFVMKEIPLNSKMNPNDIIKQSAFPVFYEEQNLKTTSLIYTAAKPKLTEGKSYVWRVQAYQIGQNSSFIKQDGYSESCVFHYKSVIPPIEYTPKITLISPSNNGKSPVQQTDQGEFFHEFKYNMPPAEKISMVDFILCNLKDGQSPEQAIKNNPNLNTFDKGPSPTKTGFKWPQELKPGKYAWRVDGYPSFTDNKGKLESPVWTFEVPTPESGDFKSFMICNIEVFPTKITNSNLENFVGEGYYYLKKDNKDPGIKQLVNFNGIKLKHTAKDASGKKIKYTCYNGLVAAWDIKNVEYELDPQNNLEGSFVYKAKVAKMEANIVPQYDASKDIYRIEEGDKGEGCNNTIEGELTWNSDILYKTGSKYAGQNLPIGDCNKDQMFCGQGILKLKLRVINSVAKFDHDLVLNTSNPEGAVLTFGKESYFSIIGNKITANLQGTFSINSGKKLSIGNGVSFDPGLSYSFSYAQGSLIKLIPSASNMKEIFWDKKGNVYSDLSQTETWLRLGQKKPSDAVNTTKRGLIIFPYVNVKYAGTKEFKFTIPYMINEGNGFTISKAKPFEGLSLYKFSAKADKFDFRVVNSKLIALKITGNIEVPFVNIKAPFSIQGNYDEKPTGSINFSNEIATVIESESQKVSVKPYSATLIDDETIQMDGNFKFETKGSQDVVTPNQTFSAENVYMEGIIIKADNTISNTGIVKNFNWQVPALYNGFDYNLTSYRLTTINGKNTIRLWGDIVLEEQTIAPKEKMKMEFSYTPRPYPFLPMDYHTLYASKERFLYLPPPTDVEIKSNGFKAKSVSNGCTDFEVEFQYKNDDIYGKGFIASADITMKEPAVSKLSTKVMVGRAKTGYKYWFLEAGFQPMKSVNTGILDIAAYDFVGRIYYHMTHSEGGDIDASNYVPSVYSKYGIYGKVGLKTEGSDGKVLWGSLSTEITTKSSGGLMPIKIKGEAYILSDGVGDKNAKAHGVADLTLNVMSPRYLAGNITVDANIYDMVQAHAPISLHMGDGKWYLHMGTPENMMKAYVPELGKELGGYFTIDKIGGNARLGVGIDGEIFGFHASKKKCIGYKSLSCCFKAGADVSLKGRVEAHAQVPSIQIGGTISLTASAQVCASACGIGGCPGISATMTGAFEVPDPFCVAGSFTLVTPNKFPNIGVNVRYKDGAIESINHCQ